MLSRILLTGAFWLGVAARGAAGPPASDFEKAVGLYDARKYSAAERVFEQFDARQPGNPEVEFRLGSIALWFDDETRGREYLERAVRAKPNDARYEDALGNAYGLMAQKAPFFSKFGWAKKCLAAYSHAAEIEPDNPDCHWSLLSFYMQAPRIVGGGLDKARAEAAVIRRLNDTEGRIAWVTVDLAQKKFDEAFQVFDDVLRVSPDDFLALYQVGRCAAVSGAQLARGRAALERCLGLPPPAGPDRPTYSNVHYRLGNILEKMGEPAAAQAEYAAFRAADPDLRPDKDALKN